MKRLKQTVSFIAFQIAVPAALRTQRGMDRWKTPSAHLNTEMTVDPRKTDNLTPSEECVYAFLGTTNYWRTAREVALSTGTCEPKVKAIIRHLVRLGIVKKRKRNYGFDNGILEFKAGARTAERIREKRSRERWASITGVEPLYVKLRRFLGAQRAREAERYFNGGRV